MMKRLLQLSILMGMMLAFTACNQDLLEGDIPKKEVPEGYVAVSFKAQIPDMTEVQTRAVDPDGLDIHNMKLFCFNTYGLFITVAYATELNADNQNYTGTFDAVIPSETEVIHFIANQNIGQYDLSDFAGKSEAEVLSAMEGGSGMIIYWGRFKKTGDTDIKTQLQALTNGVTLYRNQAMVSIKDNNWQTEHFTVTGFRTTNIHAYGTLAPYSSDSGWDGFLFPHNFVTLPANEAKLSDIVGVNTAKADYIFEHENTLDDPVSVIIRGQNNGSTEKLYYRVLLQDENGELLKVLRNHHYIIHIVGKLSYGQKTFQEALTAPATNNVWVAVDDWVNEISDGANTLGVDETHIVLNASDYAGKSYTFNYTATKEPEVSWMDGNKVAKEIVSNVYGDGVGTVTVDLLAMASSVSQQSGTLVLKMGQMYRRVNITVVRTMSFTPSWVSSNVHLDAGENITLMFTVPEDCPEGLFPFPVMVSTNDLDVRAASGMKLAVRTKGEVDWYGADNELGYKYEYMVEEPGVHRLYFSSVLPHNVGDTEEITLEAEFFSTLTKKVNFTDTEHQITLPKAGTNPFQFFNGSAVSGFQDDEPIYYLLVPQKKGAEVTFNVEFDKRGNNGTLIDKTTGTADEFFLFSKMLDVTENGYTANVIDASGSPTSGFNGRTILFYPNSQVSTLTMKATTNKAKSADVVRISSNKKTSYSAKNQSSGLYTGDEYRSAIFELANYRPFGFEAQVKYNNEMIGTWGTGMGYGQDNESSHVEPIDHVELTYEPDQQVEVSFDLKTFTGSDNKVVSPFGSEFKIYIDAPMLVLGTNPPASVRKDENKEGRFIYTVPANATASGRVSIPFVKKGITAVGEIVLSTDEEEIVFYKKTFKVTTKNMTGTIEYNDGTNNVNVPKDAFVAFIHTATNSRIGVMTITADGQYELNLRSEYVFNWTDKIELDYKASDGNVYERKGDDFTLGNLYQNPNVVLTKAVETTNSGTSN